MKILFNNNFINPSSKTNKHQATQAFGEKLHGIDKIPDRDIFLSSRSSASKYIDDKIISNIQGSASFSPKVIMLAKLNYAAVSLLKEARDRLPALKKGEISLEQIKNIALRQYSPEAKEYLENALEKADITSNEKLMELMQIYEALIKKKWFNVTNAREVLLLYGELKNPQDILNFSDILFEACTSNEALGKDYNYEKIIQFTKQMGAKNEDVLFNKIFAHMSENFNNFETPDDRLQALELARRNYPFKKATLESVKDYCIEFGNCEDIDVDDFYSRNTSLVDYIFDKEDDVFDKLCLAMQVDELYNVAPYTINALSSLVDAKTPKGKIELYEFIACEELSPTELDELTKQSYYEGLSCADVIVNRMDTIKEMVDYYNIPEEIAKICYLNLGHTINVAKNSDVKFFADPLFTLIFASTNLGFTTDKEFSDFYFELTKGNNKSQKNKKGQQKITQKEAVNFINLLSFLEFDIAFQYKQDKKFPLYAELKKRKVEFEKVQDKIEKLIDKHNARRYLKDAFYTYKEYIDFYPYSKNLETFVLDAIESEKEKARESSSLEEKFLYYFSTEALLEEFLTKNKIKLNEDDNHAKLVNKIIDCLTFRKDEKTALDLCKKLAKSDFIVNSQNVLAKFVVSRSEEELQILLEIALNEDISSAQELLAMIKPYLNKQKQIDKLLAHYKAQNLDFRSYLAKIAQIQKDLDNLGFSIVLNNDNIEKLDLEELQNNRLNLTQALKIATAILKPDEGNFVLGTKEATCEEHLPYTAGQIAKELTSSQTGRYKENYHGFLNFFNLKTTDLGFKNPNAQYEEALRDTIRKAMPQLTQLLNSDIYMPEFSNGKVPNITLHARMRLIDRFILQENKNPFDESSFAEIKEILQTVYTKTPYKMEKAKGGFALYFKYGENEEIKAVFEKDGQMLTIAKNKL